MFCVAVQDLVRTVEERGRRLGGPYQEGRCAKVRRQPHIQKSEIFMFEVEAKPPYVRAPGIYHGDQRVKRLQHTSDTNCQIKI